MSDLDSILDAIGQLEDNEIELADAALQLARRRAPTADWHEVRAQLSTVARASAALAEKIDPLDLPACAAMLSWLLHDEMGFVGDSLTYDDLANANLIQLFERRRGLPVTLGIVWIHAAQAAGWEAYGVNFPGQFLVGLAAGNRQVLLDVFDGGRVLDPDDLRELLRRLQGRRVALRRDMLEPMSHRAVLLRMQGNIRSRQEQQGQFGAALATTIDMQRIAPLDPGLRLDADRLRGQLN